MGMAPNWGAVQGGWGRTEGFVLKDRLPLLAVRSAKEVECVYQVCTDIVCWTYMWTLPIDNAMGHATPEGSGLKLQACIELRRMWLGWTVLLVLAGLGHMPGTQLAVS